MGYRDDRDAWRLKAEQLERDLERAQREISEMKGGDRRTGDPHGSVGPVRPVHRGARRPGAGVVVLVLFTVVVTAAALFASGVPFEMVVGMALPFVMLAAMVLMLSHSLEVVPPNRALVVSGRQHQRSDGSASGYRVVRAGRVVRMPIVESTDVLDLSLIRVETRLQGAFSRGGLPLTVDLAAWVGIEPSSEGIHLAAERFLGQSQEQIASVAVQTIEGAAREAIAGMTPEEIIEDRLALRHRIMEAADESMRKLGLSFEGVFVRSVDDAQGHVSSLGRETIARALRDAEVRESEARR
jgi:flotillin